MVKLGASENELLRMRTQKCRIAVAKKVLLLLGVAKIFEDIAAVA